MKKNYFYFQSILVAIVAIMLLGQKNLNAQITTQTYSYTGAMQNWTVPSLCVNAVTIEARGAQGGDNVTLQGLGGKGAQMIGTFTATPGSVLKIIVGGRGSNNQGGNANNGAGGGGGGSFVYVQGTNQLLIAAGGGGGSCLTNNGIPNYYGKDASITNTSTGSRSNDVFNDSPGATAGNDGTVICGSGGKGWSNVLINPSGNPSGNVTYGAAGGYGGGGGAGTAPGGCNYLHTGGGGGGYAGGGAGGTCYYHGGGGGASYNIGTNQVNTGTVQTGDGLVVIKYSQGTPITTTISPFAICSGGSASLSAGGMLSYTWSTGPNTSSIVVTPTSTTTYTVQGTNVQNCITTAVLTVTVNAGAPVLSVNTSTNITCLGKTVTLTATGAITYTWSNGVTNGVTYSPTATQSYTVSGQNGCGTTTAVTTITVAPLPISAIVSPTLTCANNPATLTAVGPATLFTWTPFQVVLTGSLVPVNPSVTTLWTVTATDGTCSGTATVLLNVNPNPTVNVVASASMVCEGYSVGMNATGGLSYTWNPGNLTGSSVTVNPTAPTLYTVSATNSLGCVAGTSQIVLTSPSPTVTLVTSNTLICLGDMVNLSASGADSYSWSSGQTTNTVSLTPSLTTSYTVVGTSTANTCSSKKGVIITVFSPPLQVTGTPTICSGGNATLNATGADGYTWSTGQNGNLVVVSPTISSTYTISASSATVNLVCGISKTISVGVNPRPTVTAVSSKTTICKNESAILTAGGAGSYTWTIPSGGAASGLSNPSITVSPSITILFTYTVTGTDSFGCTNVATTQLRVNPCLGLFANFIGNTELVIYPNPSAGEFVVTNNAEISLNLINELGQHIRSVELNEGNKYSARVSELSNGIYFVTGQNKQQKVYQKIIVNK